MDKILALLLSVVPTSHAQIVQNDAHSYVESVAVGKVVNCDKDALTASLEASGLYTKDDGGRYVLDVTKINDDYNYVLKDKQNNEEIKFVVEANLDTKLDKKLPFFNKKINEEQDKAAFDTASEDIKLLH